LLKIIEYPNLSTRPAHDVTTFGPELRKLVDEMAEAMYAGNGVGLAAPQVAVDSRVLLIDPSAGEDSIQMTAMINPRVTWSSPEMEADAEGCLSLPGVQLQVPRHVAVEVEYYDLMGTKRLMRYAGFASRIAQHEIDHLSGYVMLNRVGPLARREAFRNVGARA
jgi:peptide deformylase